MFLFSASGNLPLPRSKFRRIWMELMIAAGFAEPELKSEITPHYFRHNYATMLYNAGVDPVVATRILGHASYSTTARIYTHLGEHNIIDAGKKINTKLAMKKDANRLPSSKK